MFWHLGCSFQTLFRDLDLDFGLITGSFGQSLARFELCKLWSPKRAKSNLKSKPRKPTSKPPTLNFLAAAPRDLGPSEASKWPFQTPKTLRVKGKMAQKKKNVGPSEASKWPFQTLKTLRFKGKLAIFGAKNAVNLGENESPKRAPKEPKAV